MAHHASSANLRFAHPEALASLRHEYEQKVERDSAALDELHGQNEQLHAEELHRARLHLLLVEKREAMVSFHHGGLNQSAQQKLFTDIDARLLRLESAEK